MEGRDTAAGGADLGACSIPGRQETSLVPCGPWLVVLGDQRECG